REVVIAPELALPPAPPITADPRHETSRWKGLVQVELAPYTVLCRSLKAAIEGTPAASPVTPATFADGVACMRVMDAIRASAKGGGKLMAV
ncbi:MAG: gfo/Idh/MocA family oxidoreductase, partial [Sphingomonadales bacterium]|nr:gfo/Idh/MocA family oxidoreductase [Sphingomonadales bacterium]